MPSVVSKRIFRSGIEEEMMILLSSSSVDACVFNWGALFTLFAYIYLISLSS
jgi:hypothetical protein